MVNNEGYDGVNDGESWLFSNNDRDLTNRNDGIEKKQWHGIYAIWNVRINYVATSHWDVTASMVW